MDSREAEVPVRIRGELEVWVRVGENRYRLGTGELGGGDQVELCDVLAAALRELAGALQAAGRQGAPAGSGYVWGTSGSDGFDCSGLTDEAAKRGGGDG